MLLLFICCFDTYRPYIIAREKIGQQLRESLGGKYKSSHSAKKGRRRSSTSIACHSSMEDVVHSNHEVSKTITRMTQQILSLLSISSSPAPPPPPPPPSPSQSGSSSTTTAQHSPHLSSTTAAAAAGSNKDKEIVEIFNQGNSYILDVLKKDKSLLTRFQQAAGTSATSTEEAGSEYDVNQTTTKEVSSWAIQNQDDDDDHEMEIQQHDNMGFHHHHHHHHHNNNNYYH